MRRFVCEGKEFMDSKFHLEKSDKAKLICLAVILALVFLGAAAYCVQFMLNRMTLEVQLLGDDSIGIEYGGHYSEPGYRVLLRGEPFLQDGMEIDAKMEISGRVQEENLGNYTLQYHASWMGLEADAYRMVRVADTSAPVISLVPDSPDLQPAAQYREAGFSAFDNYDGDITDRVKRTEEPGKITYTVADSSGNLAVVQREIPLYDDYPPTLSLIGGSQISIPLGEAFQEPGYVASDMRDGDLTTQVSVSIDHPFLRYQQDTYHLTYHVTDSDGREAVAERTVTTVPSSPPTIIYPKGKTIYLTFDDGPGPDTGRLLDVLAKYNVHATFFVVDTGYPELMRRIVNEGHSIGIHTCSHKYQQIYANPEAYFQDMFQMQQVIQNATGTQTWLLRFPGGSSNTISRKSHGIMTYLTKAVEACGFSYFDWNVDSGDAGGAKTSGQVFQNVVNGVGESQYCVVLQHDIHSFSVDAVEQIIQWGLRNGYQFLPLQTDSPVMHHAVQN